MPKTRLWWCTGDKECWFTLGCYEQAGMLSPHYGFRRAFEIRDNVEVMDTTSCMVRDKEMRYLGMRWLERRPDGVDCAVPTEAISDDGEFQAVAIEVHRPRSHSAPPPSSSAGWDHVDPEPRIVTFVRDVARPYYRGIPIQWPHLVRNSAKSMLDMSWYEGYAFDPESDEVEAGKAHKVAMLTGRGSTVAEAIDDLLSIVDEWLDDEVP
jgi:hypothetical protein